MRLKTAICDDEEQGILLIKKLISHYHFDTGVEFDIKEYNDPDTFVRDYESGFFDILFLDMEMPRSLKFKHGIDVAKHIRAIPDTELKIIFFSNYPEYMHLGYDVQSTHYLSKDVEFRKFDSVMNSLIAGLSNDQSIIRIKTGHNDWALVRIRDILYVKSALGKRDFVSYYTSNGLFEERKNISTVYDELKPHGFVFSNNHHLINLHHIQRFSRETIILDCGYEINLSRYYRKEFLGAFSRDIIKTI